ncbi:MAG: hypothetical protein GY861_01760, partial [bacterium]|nr:hypothetical protein [bacterium]
GIETDDPNIKEKIYNQYVEAYKKGIYNYIRRDYDPNLGENINRRYYSGGQEFGDLSGTLEKRPGSKKKNMGIDKALIAPIEFEVVKEDGSADTAKVSDTSVKKDRDPNGPQGGWVGYSWTNIKAGFKRIFKGGVFTRGEKNPQSIAEEAWNSVAKRGFFRGVIHYGFRFWRLVFTFLPLIPIGAKKIRSAHDGAAGVSTRGKKNSQSITEDAWNKQVLTREQKEIATLIQNTSDIVNMLSLDSEDKARITKSISLAEDYMDLRNRLESGFAPIVQKVSERVRQDGDRETPLDVSEELAEQIMDAAVGVEIDLDIKTTIERIARERKEKSDRHLSPQITGLTETAVQKAMEAFKTVIDRDAHAQLEGTTKKIEEAVVELLTMLDFGSKVDIYSDRGDGDDRAYMSSQVAVHAFSKEDGSIWLHINQTDYGRNDFFLCNSLSANDTATKSDDIDRDPNGSPYQLLGEIATDDQAIKWLADEEGLTLTQIMQFITHPRITHPRHRNTVREELNILINLGVIEIARKVGKTPYYRFSEDARNLISTTGLIDLASARRLFTEIREIDGYQAHQRQGTKPLYWGSIPESVASEVRKEIAEIYRSNKERGHRLHYIPRTTSRYDPDFVKSSEYDPNDPDIGKTYRKWQDRMYPEGDDDGDDDFYSNGSPYQLLGEIADLTNLEAIRGLANEEGLTLTQIIEYVDPNRPNHRKTVRGELNILINLGVIEIARVVGNTNYYRFVSTIRGIASDLNVVNLANTAGLLNEIREIDLGYRAYRRKGTKPLYWGSIPESVFNEVAALVQKKIIQNAIVASDLLSMAELSLAKPPMAAELFGEVIILEPELPHPFHADREGEVGMQDGEHVQGSLSEFLKSVKGVDNDKVLSELLTDRGLTVNEIAEHSPISEGSETDAKVLHGKKAVAKEVNLLVQAGILEHTGKDSDRHQAVRPIDERFYILHHGQGMGAAFIGNIDDDAPDSSQGEPIIKSGVIEKLVGDVNSFGNDLGIFWMKDEEIKEALRELFAGKQEATKVIPGQILWNEGLSPEPDAWVDISMDESGNIMLTARDELGEWTSGHDADTGEEIKEVTKKVIWNASATKAPNGSPYQLLGEIADQAVGGLASEEGLTFTQILNYIEHPRHRDTVRGELRTLINLGVVEIARAVGNTNYYRFAETIRNIIAHYKEYYEEGGSLARARILLSRISEIDLGYRDDRREGTMPLYWGSIPERMLDKVYELVQEELKKHDIEERREFEGGLAIHTDAPLDGEATLELHEQYHKEFGARDRELYPELYAANALSQTATGGIDYGTMDATVDVQNEGIYRMTMQELPFKVESVAGLRANVLMVSKIDDPNQVFVSRRNREFASSKAPVRPNRKPVPMPQPLCLAAVAVIKERSIKVAKS